jgi:hypothetical protein
LMVQKTSSADSVAAIGDKRAQNNPGALVAVKDLRLLRLRARGSQRQGGSEVLEEFEQAISGTVSSRTRLEWSRSGQRPLLQGEVGVQIDLRRRR